MSKPQQKRKLSRYASLFYNAVATGLAFSFTLLPPPGAGADGQQRDRNALKGNWPAISGDLWRVYNREIGR